jgi:large subunit ribosomal protein L15
MPLKLNNLRPAKGSNERRFRVGRGHGTGIGKTSGRGTKGQKARSGKSGLRIKAFRPLLLSMPKRRGFLSHKPNVAEVTLAQFAEHFPHGGAVTRQALEKVGLVSSHDKSVKLIASGTIKAAYILKGIQCSAGAKVIIEKAGGKVGQETV